MFYLSVPAAGSSRPQGTGHGNSESSLTHYMSPYYRDVRKRARPESMLCPMKRKSSHIAKTTIGAPHGRCVSLGGWT